MTVENITTGQNTTSGVFNNFTSHAVTETDSKTIATWRTKLAELATWATENIPGGREQAVVLTKLEEAMFWGSAAIARTSSTKGNTAAGGSAA